MFVYKVIQELLVHQRMQRNIIQVLVDETVKVIIETILVFLINQLIEDDVKADHGQRVFIDHTIPVIVLTTSEAEQDVIRTYDLGVNSFIVKPVTFDSLVGIMKTVTEYWMQIVRLPSLELRAQ